jgi:hypothetical protein
MYCWQWSVCPSKRQEKAARPFKSRAEDGRSGYIRQTFEVSNIDG